MKFVEMNKYDGFAFWDIFLGPNYLMENRLYVLRLAEYGLCDNVYIYEGSRKD